MENEQTQKYHNFISAQNFPEDPKRYPNCWRNILKNTNFTENFFGNFSFLLDMENEQTQKYQNFISAQNFAEDPKKYQNQNFIP